MDFLLKAKLCTVGGSGRLAAAVGHRLVRWRATDLKSPAMALPCVPDLTVEDAAQLGNLKAAGIIGLQSSRSPGAAWAHQRPHD